jgi:hypothetical protein
MSADTISTLIIVVCIGWPIAWIVWSRWRAEQVLTRWLEQNSYQLVRRSSSGPKGSSPFRWTMPLNQFVRHVEVVTAEGQRRSGWIRIGNATLGPVTDRVEARWDS